MKLGEEDELSEPLFGNEILLERKKGR